MGSTHQVTYLRSWCFHAGLTRRRRAPTSSRSLLARAPLLRRAGAPARARRSTREVRSAARCRAAPPAAARRVGRLAARRAAGLFARCCGVCLPLTRVYSLSSVLSQTGSADGKAYASTSKPLHSERHLARKTAGSSCSRPSLFACEGAQTYARLRVIYVFIYYT